MTGLVMGDMCHPIAISDLNDPYKVGGCNLINNDHPNIDGHVNWQEFSTQGNLGIIGLLECSCPPVDLAISEVVYGAKDFKLVGQPYTYSATVTNFGTQAQSNYVVQLLDENNDVLVEETITSTLASGTILVVDLEYASHVAGYIPLKARVIVEGDAVPANNTSASTYFKLFPEQPMTYVIDSDNFAGGWRYGAGKMHLAFRYPAASMGPLAGKELKGFYYAVRCAATCIIPPATIWVRTESLDNPKTILGTHHNIVEGWNYCEFATPYVLTEEVTYVGVSYLVYPDGYYNALLNEPEDVMPKDYVNAMFSTITNEGEEPTGEDWLAGGHELGNNVLIAVVGPPTCPKPTAFDVVYEKDAEDKCIAAVLTWSAPAKEDITYNVYRGSTRIGITTETIFRDEELNIEQGYSWSVAAACPEGGESNRVEKSMDPCKGISIKEIVKTAFTIVPNPAKDKIKISAESNFNKVEVINFLGQTVITQNNDTNHITLDISNLTNGVYFVRITSNNGTNIKKFVKQ